MFKSTQGLVSLFFGELDSGIVAIILVVMSVLISWYFFRRSRKERTAKDIEQLRITANEAERKHVDVLKQLESKAKELEKMAMFRNQLFQDISHELRTPLTLIKGPAANLLKHSRLSLPERQKMHQIYRNVHRLSQLVEQLADLNRLESGNTVHLHIRKVNLSKFIGLIVESFSELMQSKQLSWDISIPKSSIYAYIDPDKIEKVIFNILSNACKFTPFGGTIFILLKENEDDVEFHITDSGIGMDEEEIETLFARFETIGKQGGKYRLGLGIGMSLSKEYLDKHSARIEVKSDKKKGTSFVISFLQGKDHFSPDMISEELFSTETSFLPEPLHIETSSNIVPLKNQTVLVVEDNVELSSYIVSLLKERGYTVQVAVNGAEGLKSIRENPPDIIVSDIMMPVMDGFELLKELRRDENLRFIPAIFLTALTDIEDKIRSFQIGVNDYILKPFDASELLVRIRNLLHFRQERLAPHKEIKQSDDTGKNGNPLENDDALIAYISNWIEESLGSDNMTIEMLALSLAMSRSALYREIKRLTGFPPAAFIKELRLQYARRMVESNKVSGIKELSKKVGYSNTTYFRDQFIQRFGKEPFV